MSSNKLPKELSFLANLFRGNGSVRWENLPEAGRERLLREHLKTLRLRLKKSAGGRSRSLGQGLARDKFVRSQARKAMKIVRRRPRAIIEKDVLVAKFRHSPILDRLIPNRQRDWTPILRRSNPKIDPSIRLKDFSFLDDPDRTITAIKGIGEMELRNIRSYIHFEDEYCLDAGAYLALAEVWPQMAPIFQGGRMNNAVQKVLNATGWGRHNRLSLVAAEKDIDFIIDGKHADVWAFPLQRRRPARSSMSATVHLDPQTREEASDRFCAAVDEWLGVPEIAQELTDEGKSHVGGMIGELLCNAERHSQAGTNDGDWSTTAFMVRREENGRSVLRCHMAFLSVGRSFSESLNDATSEIRTALQSYQRRHRGADVSPEALATVFALQDTITCDPAAHSEGSGGTGLQDVLDFVRFLGGPTNADSDTRVAIVSGRTCIRLKHPYLKGVRRGPDEPRLLWCNAQNSSDFPPDADIVTSLSEHFAGTLVSVAFALDPVYLASLVEVEGNEDD